ncbi:MAG: phage tail protein [Candidatus Methanoperedens sp.]
MEEKNYKVINTQDLWEYFKKDTDNLSIENECLKLQTTQVYEFVKDIINDKNLKIKDIAVDEYNVIYILNEDKVILYDAQNIKNNGCKLRVLPIKLKSPSGIGVIKDRIYIADNKKLTAYNKNNLKECGVLSEYKGQPLNKIIDLATGFEDFIFIIEKGKKSRILKIKDDLSIDQDFSISPEDQEKLSNPTDIAVDKKGDIYVLDSQKVHKFGKNGEYRDIIPIEIKEYLFSWDNILGSDKERLIDFLKQNYSVDWLKTENIEKIGDKIIRIYNETNSLLLELNDKKTGVNLKIDDRTNEKFLVKIENSKLNIYKYIIPKGLIVDAKNIFVGVDNKTPKEKRTIYAFNKDSVLDKNRSWYPVWSYRDAARKLITDSKGNLYVVNDKGNKLTFLEYKKVNKLNKEGLYSGYYISKPIDSNDTKTRWRRFLLKGDFQKGSQIEFSYYISNDNSTDNNIIYFEKLSHNSLTGTSAVQGEEKREALFQEDIQGRYLRFKITLIGNENISPIVKSLKVFFPERSFIDYLPAIYQGDNTIRDFPENFANSGFLERFLSIFESIYFYIDFEIDHLSRLFDAWGTPCEFVSWLGSWLAIPLEENFPENMKRLYIQRAISLYKKRGTKEGLEETIAFFLYTKKHPYLKMKDITAQYEDEKPFIIENFNTARLPGNKRIKESNVTKDTLFFPPPEARTIKPDGKEEALLDVLFGKEPFSFYVYLRDTNLDENIISTIKRIIDEQKPAHTCYGLKVLEPAFHLDMHTYLEVNTVLTKSGFIIGKTAVMGRNTILDDKDLD